MHTYESFEFKSYDTCCIETYSTIIIESKAFIESLDFESYDSRINYLVKLQIHIYKVFKKYNMRILNFEKQF